MTLFEPGVGGGCRPLPTDATGGIWGHMSNSGRPSADMMIMKMIPTHNIIIIYDDRSIDFIGDQELNFLVQY